MFPSGWRRTLMRDAARVGAMLRKGNIRRSAIERPASVKAVENTSKLTWSSTAGWRGTRGATVSGRTEAAVCGGSFGLAADAKDGHYFTLANTLLCRQFHAGFRFMNRCSTACTGWWTRPRSVWRFAWPCRVHDGAGLPELLTIAAGHDPRVPRRGRAQRAVPQLARHAAAARNSPACC